jgi:hypothetical protein
LGGSKLSLEGNKLSWEGSKTPFLEDFASFWEKALLEGKINSSV